MADVYQYSKWNLSMASKLVDVTADSFFCMLLDTYTVGTTQDDAQFLADVLAAAAEIATTGPYTAGGIELTNSAAPGLSVAMSGATLTLGNDDPTWGAGALTASYAVFYDRTPATDATRPVIGFVDFGGAVTLNPFVVTMNAAGLFTATRS